MSLPAFLQRNCALGHEVPPAFSGPRLFEHRGNGRRTVNQLWHQHAGNARRPVKRLAQGNHATRESKRSSLDVVATVSLRKGFHLSMNRHRSCHSQRVV